MSPGCIDVTYLIIEVIENVTFQILPSQVCWWNVGSREITLAQAESLNGVGVRAGCLGPFR